MGKAVIVSEQGEGLYTVRKEVAGLEQARLLIAEQRAKLEAELPDLQAEEEAAKIETAYRRSVADSLVDDWAAGIDIPEESLTFEFRYGITDEARRYIEGGVEGKVTGFEVPEAVLNAIHALVEARQNLDDITRRLNEKSAQYLALLKRQSELTALDASVQTPVSAWCADFTEDLIGEVATLEVPGEVDPLIGGGLNIKPGNQDQAAWNEGYGQIQMGSVISPAAFAWNFTMLTPWMKWMPRWRYATVQSINRQADRMTLAVHPVLSKVGAYLRKDLTINNFIGAVLEDVEVDYMGCNSSAFEVDDEAIVEFREEVGEQGKEFKPVVIGFKDNPVNCSASSFIFYPRIGNFPDEFYGGIYRDPGAAPINFSVSSNSFSYLHVSHNNGAYTFKIKAPELAVYGNQFFSFEGIVYSWWHSSTGDGPVVSDFFYDHSFGQRFNTAFYFVHARRVDPLVGPRFYFRLPSGSSAQIPRHIYRRNGIFYTAPSAHSIISGFWIGRYDHEPIAGLTNKKQRCLIALTHLSPSVYTELRAYRVDQDEELNLVLTEISEQNPFRLYPFETGETWNYLNFEDNAIHGLWPVRFNQDGTQCASLYCSSLDGIYSDGVRDFIETVVVNIQNTLSSVSFVRSTQNKVSNSRTYRESKKQIIDGPDFQNFSATYAYFLGTTYQSTWPIALDYDNGNILRYVNLTRSGDEGQFDNHNMSRSYEGSWLSTYAEDECGDKSDTVYSEKSLSRNNNFYYSRIFKSVFSFVFAFPGTTVNVESLITTESDIRTGAASASGSASTRNCYAYNEINPSAWGEFVEGTGPGLKTECISLNSRRSFDQTFVRGLGIGVRCVKVIDNALLYHIPTFFNYINLTDNYNICLTVDFDQLGMSVSPGQLSEYYQQVLAAYSKTSSSTTDLRGVMEMKIAGVTIFDFNGTYQLDGPEVDDPINNVPGYEVYSPSFLYDDHNIDTSNTILVDAESAVNVIGIFSGHSFAYNLSHSFVVDQRGLDFGFPALPWAVSYSLSNKHFSDGPWYQAGTDSSFGPLNSKIFYLDEEGNLDLDAPVTDDALTLYPIGLQ